MNPELSRRDLLKIASTGAAMLTLGLFLPGRRADAASLAPLEPNAFVRIDSNGRVTVIAKHLEMGQGSHTGLATLVAEELDADWSQVQVEGAAADAARYQNLFWGGSQGTGGSSSLANSWKQLREAGASARLMLVNAAAERWGVPAAEIRVERGVLSHRAGHRAGFGELVEAAARQPVPTQVKLKSPGEFRLIGRHVPRLDSRDKTTGRARFTQDVQLLDMLTAVVAHPPRFGARLRGIDSQAAAKLPGVVEVVRFDHGVAVLGRDFWSAKTGRDALKLDWDESAAMSEGSAELLASYRGLASQPGAVARRLGDADAILNRGGRVLEADFVFPFLAHAAMEPLNCVVHLRPDGCEIWNGEQMQTGDQAAVAKLLGLKPQQVKLNMLYAGGSFGRRANPAADYVLEAVSIARAARHRGPIKMVWTREDDLRAGWYRPLYLHRVSVTLDEHGRPLAWRQRIVGQSIMTGTPFEAFGVKNGIDSTSVEGAANLAYQVPHLQVELHSTQNQVPVQWWRSVGHTHTAYSTEVMIDQAARAARQDPVAYRLALLDQHPRHAAVLKLAAERAGWQRPFQQKGPRGLRRGRGVAVHESFGTVVAQVAEVALARDGSLKVERVVCAVDCGIAVNPDVIRAQLEGGIGYGLAAILHGAVTLEGGRVQQSNFHDYPVLRINEMPRIEVHILPSDRPPSGVGEPGVPPIGPAVANALAHIEGRWPTVLPLKTRSA
ncbi:xanthine dehydrogenase family protein molybdopterin-binding subunit [Chitinimonas lacunae]|uniref:Molybdopterin cofactor-binding domain-containing protein n=1 Tax=Chitinimonas lacunae TaxID=1963018 RepID=A0ABV8MPK0_9NEIS